MDVTQKIASAIGTGVLLIGTTLWFKPQKAQRLPHNTVSSVRLVQGVETVLAGNSGIAAVDATLKRESNFLA